MPLCQQNRMHYEEGKKKKRKQKTAEFERALWPSTGPARYFVTHTEYQDVRGLTF
jgi:hypothetical protein